jgi:hypothetical protein
VRGVIEGPLVVVIGFGVTGLGVPMHDGRAFAMAQVNMLWR